MGDGGGPRFAVGRRASLMEGGRVDGHRARLMDGSWGEDHGLWLGVMPV
jgi:hypothetical protein